MLIDKKGICEMEDEGKKVDWLIIIPVSFWLCCMGISAGKLLQTGNEIHILDWIDVYNSNTFSTYISLILCMAYQFFSADGKSDPEKSGLSRKWIALTIISTIVYGVIGIVNACRYCFVSTVIMAVASVAYIVLFFKYMKKRNS